MKFDKKLYKNYFVGIILIALFFYQFYLNTEIKAYKEEGRMDKVTIANNSMEISKLNKDIEELKQSRDSIIKLNEVLKKSNDFKDAIDILNKTTSFPVDNRKKVVDETFYETGLWLIPQTEFINSDDYDLADIRPYVYEYIDDSVFIYYFRGVDHLVDGEKDFEKTFENFNSEDIYKYQVTDNTLILYIPLNPQNTELVNVQKNKIENAVTAIEEKLK
jgi:hypothetical protein